MTYFGIANADGRVPTPIGNDPGGTPIFTRGTGFGFLFVVEGRRGTSGSPVGQKVFNYDPNDSTVRPDLQILTDTALGDGSTAVCDTGGLPQATPNLTPIPAGGVPASALTFGPGQAISDAMNDLACRFDVHETADRACTLDSGGNFAFAGKDAGSEIQFCGVATHTLTLRSGDTKLSAQLVDAAGHLGDRRSIIIRVP
ncbi:MAG TPA: hypothetical protein VMW17_12995 [Candidatus Binatia bacterium]|nr:hypothetical protein [Candidatus Binatia bacterium]